MLLRAGELVRLSRAAIVFIKTDSWPYDINDSVWSTSTTTITVKDAELPSKLFLLVNDCEIDPSNDTNKFGRDPEFFARIFHPSYGLSVVRKEYVRKVK